jgi:chromosomal replication initiation ATPase DnaA
LGMILSKEVRQYLIENYGSNMMVLKGCLAKLEFISNVLEREITVSFCQEIL